MQDTAAPNVIPLDSSGLGDRSYIAHDGARALVVDPQRDFDRIEQLLGQYGLTLSHVAETHIHNDYVTGGLELARRHGATYVVPGDVELSYDAMAVRDGDSFTVGEMTVDVIHTPGHTPHHISFAVRKGDHLGAVFTGGSLLYGSVGRPDLVAPDMAVKQAHDQWHSVRRLADTLDDATPIYPTHGFGSFCAATQAQGLSSTIGNEKTINPALTEAEEEFVAKLLAGLDVFPAYYAHMGPANAAGPRDVDLTMPEQADPAVLRERITRGEWVVDLRSRKVFAAGHVPGAVNFDLDGPFINYLAWMMPWGTPVTLLGSTPEQVHAAHRELVRVGLTTPSVRPRVVRMSGWMNPARRGAWSRWTFMAWPRRWLQIGTSTCWTPAKPSNGRPVTLPRPSSCRSTRSLTDWRRSRGTNRYTSTADRAIVLPRSPLFYKTRVSPTSFTSMTTLPMPPLRD